MVTREADAATSKDTQLWVDSFIPDSSDGVEGVITVNKNLTEKKYLDFAVITI